MEPRAMAAVMRWPAGGLGGGWRVPWRTPMSQKRDMGHPELWGTEMVRTHS